MSFLRHAKVDKNAYHFGNSRSLHYLLNKTRKPYALESKRRTPKLIKPSEIFFFSHVIYDSLYGKAETKILAAVILRCETFYGN